MREIPCVKAKTVCLMINPEATWQIAAKCNRQMDLQMTLKLHNQIGVINGYISRGSSETCQPQIEAATVSLVGSYCVCVCVRCVWSGLGLVQTKVATAEQNLKSILVAIFVSKIAAGQVDELCPE